MADVKTPRSTARPAAIYESTAGPALVFRDYLGPVVVVALLGYGLLYAEPEVAFYFVAALVASVLIVNWGRLAYLFTPPAKTSAVPYAGVIGDAAAGGIA